MRSHIAGRWLNEVPDIISHVDAVETIITAPPKPPARIDQDPPSPVSDDLPHANALMSEPRSKVLVIWAHDHGPPSRYLAGSSSGLVTGAGLAGALLGGGGITGSAVGDTGSSNGTKVQRLIGWPICPMSHPLG